MELSDFISALALLVGGIGAWLGIRAERRARSSYRREGMEHGVIAFRALEHLLVECKSVLNVRPSELIVEGTESLQDRLHRVAEVAAVSIGAVASPFPHIVPHLTEMEGIARTLTRYPTLDLSDQQNFVWVARLLRQLYGDLRVISAMAVYRHYFAGGERKLADLLHEDPFHSHFEALWSLAHHEEISTSLDLAPEVRARIPREETHLFPPPGLT